MSYRTWTTYGYGVCTDKIETTVERIEKLLDLAPKYKDEIHKWFEEKEITEPTVSDYEEYDDEWFCGMATILKTVIMEIEDVEIDIADDFNCNHFLLYCPCYPWQLKEKEKTFTREDIENIFKKYISILTDKEINIEYHAVENGG